MLGYILVTIFFAVMVLLFCWFLLYYLYHATGRVSEKELNKLRFKNKAVYCLMRIWKRIGEGRNYSREMMKDSATKANETVSIQKFREKREKNTAPKRKDRSIR